MSVIATSLSAFLLAADTVLAESFSLLNMVLASCNHTANKREV